MSGANIRMVIVASVAGVVCAGSWPPMQSTKPMTPWLQRKLLVPVASMYFDPAGSVSRTLMPVTGSVPSLPTFTM